MVGPGLNNVDFGLFKYFHLTATNFFNHPNFGSRPHHRSTGRQVVDTLGARARTIQLGLRFDSKPDGGVRRGPGGPPHGSRKIDLSPI